ncbi:MAG: hypothetical protein IT437_07930 [Phycisphaerales bacterium]|nr:hypothetical protein [Phycisphaerales bacterium]
MHRTRRFRRGIGGAAAAVLLACGAAPAQDSTTTVPGTGDNPRTTATPSPRPGQPQAQPGKTELPPPPGEGDIELSVFSEPVDIKAFVEYVADALQIIIVGNDQLSGTVVFNAPVKVKRQGLLPLLDSLLEQHGFTIVHDPAGFYTIQASTSVKIGPGGEQSTTRLIATPGIRPSSLQQLVSGQLGGADVASRVAYLDDLGVIVITDTPRRIAALQTLITELTARLASQQLMRFEVSHIAASVARDRILKLVGAGPSSAGGVVNPQPGQPQEAVPGSGGDPTRLANLPERLTVDAQGNALIFRGEPSEADYVEKVLSVVDVPNVLETRQYFAGRAASSIADVAQSRGLGEVQEIQTRPTSAQPGMQEFMQGGGVNPATGQPVPVTASGPSIVVDSSRGLIVFSGTPSQHEQMEQLLREFNTEEEQIVVRPYKLNDADSEEVADLITGLLENRAKGTETGSLLPGQESMIENMRNLNTFGFIPPPQPGEKGEGVNFAAGQDIFVLADKANNQVLVKAPAKLQKQFADLIERLDLRRPQVYLEAKIVSVTATDDFRLGFEYQLINAGGKGGAFNFNNGLGSFGTSGFTDPKSVNTALSGFTAAIINSDYVPIIINAMQKDVDARVLATPQLLVDDNEPSTIVSEQVQQTKVTTQTVGNPAQTSVGEPQTAGTTLEVTPHISRGGYVRLEYKIEQSRFLGPSVDGIPADKERNEVSGDSVTVPQDTTVVVGGLRLSSTGDTVVKIPLLGDIPIIGHLFRDTNKNSRDTTLYVFLTPRILQEPTIQDLTLLTRGPQAEVGESQMIPPLEPLFIDIVQQNQPVPDGPGTEPVGG